MLVGHDGDGPGIQLIRELERSCASTLVLAPLSDREIAMVVTGERVDAEAIAAAVAVAGGLPGVARREAAAWAERAAADRLNVAATISIGARSAAAIAGASVLDEVLRLVEARGRRAALVGAEWSGRQPYRSLASYEPADADLFVGREVLVAELAARVLDRRLVAVVGASGSGKSSLVRAGLIPLVHSGQLPGEVPWRTAVIVPGPDPLAAIDGVARLDEPGPQLLVVDQFEEVLASGDIDAVAGRLLDLVLDPAIDVRVVVVARADQLGALTSSRPLADLLEDAQLLVGPPSDEELRRIVNEPARRSGCTVEPELVSMIASDVAGRDAALPLVSAAMAEVWERRGGDTLRAETYVEVGGLATAVERLGERAVAAVGPEGEWMLRDGMLRLVDVTDDGAWVRRRLHAADLAPELGPGIGALVDARLVTRAGDAVEVVHEVVFRAWPQMATWLEEARSDLTLERDLRAAARSWETQGRSDDDVLRGTRLQAATDWAQRRRDVPAAISELIDASRQWAERDDRAIRDQLAREQRSKRRLRGALVAASVLLVVAVAGGVLFLRQRNKAEEATRSTQVRELAGESTLALEIDPELSILLALEAVELSRSNSGQVQPEAIAALQEAVQSSRLELRIPAEQPEHVDANTDGNLVATASTSGPDAEIWDPVSGEQLRTLTDVEAGTSEGGVQGLAFGPDDLLAVSFAAMAPDGAGPPPPGVIVWNARTGTQLSRMAGVAGVYISPTFSPDGRSVAAVNGAFDGATVVTVWDVASGSERFSFEPAGTPLAVTFHPDGTSLLVADADSERIVFHSADDGRELSGVDTSGFVPEGIVVDPTGSRMAITSQTSGGIQVWDLASREPLRTIPVDDVFVVDWSPDGEQVAIVSGNQGPIHVVDASTGQEILVLRGHTTGVPDVAFLGDDHLASVGGDLRVWNVRDRGPDDLGAIGTEVGAPFGFEIAPDGSEVATMTTEGGGAIELFAAESGQPVRPPLTDRYGLPIASISPDWRLVASMRADGQGEIHDLHSLEKVGELPACTLPRGFSPDGSLLVLDASVMCTPSDGSPAQLAAPPDANLRSRVVDVASGEEILDLQERPVGASAFSPAGRFSAGRYLAVTVHDDVGHVEIYDMTTRQLIASLERPQVGGVLFDPTGRWLVGRDGDGRVWTLDLAAVVDGASADDAVVFDQPVSNGVSRAVMSVGGTLATSGNGEGLLRLWDVTTGEERLAFRTDRIDGFAPGSSGWMKFTPDGNTLLYMDATGTLHRFFMDTDRLVRLAEQRLTRGLTAEECSTYLGSSECG